MQKIFFPTRLLCFSSRLFPIILLLFSLAHPSLSQLPYGLVDGRSNTYCKVCRELIAEKPPEALFGIQVQTNGDVLFSMTNKEWFNKIFHSTAYGITVDIVSKDRYDCSKTIAGGNQLPRGLLLKPVYLPALTPELKELPGGNILVKIGIVPPELVNKELEGNLVILNRNLVCYYTDFVNIERNVLELLPMGLYTDTLLQSSSTYKEKAVDFFTYTKRIQVTVPFGKGKTTYNNNDIKPLFDSLRLQDFDARKIEIRAYSSVEGAEKINNSLMLGRANAMIRALQQFDLSIQRTKITTSENWLEFFQDIKNTSFRDFAKLSKTEIKQKLTDKNNSEQLEPLLASHRKAVITVYLEKKTDAARILANIILTEFKKAIDSKDIARARIILKEMVERIIDNKLPSAYINQLEVPMSKEYSLLLNDTEVYRYLLHITSEYEALNNFLALKVFDPANGRINYNVCALRFFVWQNNPDSAGYKALISDINLLQQQGIDNSLVKRMVINYHILKCRDDMHKYDYKAKDESLQFIRDTYKALILSDVETFSLAQYFAFYSHMDWAEELVLPRVDKIDVNENLVFYYVNLEFYHPAQYISELFRKAVLNAINLNRDRFCKFFLPNDKGGAGMQLLENNEIKSFYCESCKK